jgi:hypothetical protein
MTKIGRPKSLIDYKLRRQTINKTYQQKQKKKPKHLITSSIKDNLIKQRFISQVKFLYIKFFCYL